MPTYLPPRQGISQSEALAEAAAYAVAAQPPLLTLAFYHPSIRNPQGEPMAIYLVNDHEDLLATVEADAPLDAGQEVRFIRCPMEITLPTEADDAGPGEVAITISNVTRQLVPHLTAVAYSTEPVTMIARTYLPADTSAPHESPPMQVTLRSASATAKSVTARASFGDISNRRFPRNEYTARTHPGLTA